MGKKAAKGAKQGGVSVPQGKQGAKPAPAPTSQHMSGAERGAIIRELVAQAMWPGKGVHPARRCDARQLFEALNEQPKSHVQHREEGELHVFHYNQKVQNTCAWTPELLLARGLIFRRNARTKETTLVATPWPKFFNLQEDGYELRW